MCGASLEIYVGNLGSECPFGMCRLVWGVFGLLGIWDCKIWLGRPWVRSSSRFRDVKQSDLRGLEI